MVPWPFVVLGQRPNWLWGQTPKSSRQGLGSRCGAVRRDPLHPSSSSGAMECDPSPAFLPVCESAKGCFKTSPGVSVLMG